MVFFLSDRIYWIYWIFFSFSQFPEETEKEQSRYAGEMKPGCTFSMESHNTHLWFDPGDFICRLWRHWVFVLPSGKDKRTKKNRVNPWARPGMQWIHFNALAWIQGKQ